MFTLSLLLTGLLFGPALEPTEDSVTWRATVLMDAGTKLGGCAVGELDSAATGPEVVAVAGDGGVWLARHGDSGWKGERIAALPGEAVQCAVGDVDPRSPGAEIVCVGMLAGGEDDGGAGAVHVVRREGDSWRVDRIHESDALVHGVAIGDGTIYATGFANEVVLLERVEEGWRWSSIVDLPGAGKNVVVTAPGAIAVACNEGSLVVASSGELGYTARVLQRRDAGRARLGAESERLVVADDDGTLSVLGSGGAERVLQTEGKLRGAVFAELDPVAEDLEVATAGYNGRVFLGVRREGEWRSREIFRQDQRFHHLVAANFDGEPGDELVACGFSGELLMLVRPAAPKEEGDSEAADD